MADTTLTDLTEFAGTLAADDWVYMVDKSDTTDNPDGSSFKIQVKNIVGRVLLQTITNSSAGEFDFNSIPSGFNRLIIRGEIRGDAAGTGDQRIRSAGVSTSRRVSRSGSRRVQSARAIVAVRRRS